ncbi:MAG TPA: polyphosphate polymerase domain-containing protein [Lachnospiraceae bacterium]|nr:polyphosphate polymerase domain-containing protein [Lachnospiraceae bacterium]
MNGIFKRVEKKYILSASQYQTLMQRIGSKVTADGYGLHTICNIYYDSEHNDLIRRSIEKPVYKEKLRLRSYGIPTEGMDVFLELKKKWKGTVYKRRVELPLHVAEEYMENDRYPVVYDCQILREIDYMIHYYRLQPHLYLAYDRQAFYVTDNPEIRFTIDRRIRSRKNQLKLSLQDKGELLFDENAMLMEIKAPGALPEWFVKSLSELAIYPCSFSKYGRIYTESCDRKLPAARMMKELQ